MGTHWRKATSDDNMFVALTCSECDDRATFLQEDDSGNQRRVLDHRCDNHIGLEVLADLAHAAFARLTPEQQKQHKREQSIDFVVGNLRLDGINVTPSQVARAYDIAEFQRLVRSTRDAFHRLPIEDQRAYKVYAHRSYDDGDLNLPDFP